MPYKRIALAAALLLAAVYLKLCMPVFAAEGVPALRAVLAEQQAVLPLPPAWVERLDLG